MTKKEVFGLWRLFGLSWGCHPGHQGDAVGLVRNLMVFKVILGF